MLFPHFRCGENRNKRCGGGGFLNIRTTLCFFALAQGTPEQVARNKKSYTGQALASFFNGKEKRLSTAELLA